MTDMQSVLMIGQLLVMLVSLGGVLLLVGKTLERLDQHGKGLVKVIESVDKLENKINDHEVKLAILSEDRKYK